MGLLAARYQQGLSAIEHECPSGVIIKADVPTFVSAWASRLWVCLEDMWRLEAYVHRYCHLYNRRADFSYCTVHLITLMDPHYTPAPPICTKTTLVRNACAEQCTEQTT